jgi:hypothetical protein
MVHHKWIENKIIQYERIKQGSEWTDISEMQFRYLLEIYHTGKFNLLSKSDIIQHLDALLSKSCK